jgi:hypothetical protein
MSPQPPRRAPPPLPEGARRAGWLVDLAIMLGAFLLATLLAEAAGAANLGTALTFGTIAFAAALLWILLKRP